MKEEIFRKPDLSNRHHKLEIKHPMKSNPRALFKAWTQEFETWFATPDSAIMEGKVSTTFFSKQNLNLRNLNVHKENLTMDVF